MSFVPSTCTGTPTGCGCGSPSPFAMPSKTSMEWALANPVLCAGATAYESDTGKWKIGDGTSTYMDLPYQAEPGVAGPQGETGPAGPAGAVGPAAPLYSLVIGSVTTGPVPLATITGTPPTQTLNLVLPSSGGGGTDTLTFVSSPSDQSVYVGDDVSLYANAQSTETPIVYMWQMTTDGGANWTDVSPGQSLKFKAVLADNGKTYRCKATTATLGPVYSLLADLTVLASIPGSTWRAASQKAPVRIGYADTLFSGYGGAMSNDNGITWQDSTVALNNTPAYGNGTWSGIRHLYNSNYTPPVNQAIPHTSPDGANWTPQTALLYRMGTAVAFVGTPSNANAVPGVQPMSFLNGKFFGFLGTMAQRSPNNVIPIYSSDGDNWQAGVTSGLAFVDGWNGATAQADLCEVRGIANSATMSVAVGRGLRGNLATSPVTTNKCIRAADPKGWVGTTLPFAALWNGIAYGNGRFVAVCDGANAVTSTDGVNWAVIRMPATLNWTGIAYGNGTWVAVGGPSSISAISADGINWTKVTLPVSATWTSVAYGNGQFLMTSTTGVSLYSK